MRLRATTNCRRRKTEGREKKERGKVAGYLGSPEFVIFSDVCGGEEKWAEKKKGGKGNTSAPR